MLTEDLRKCELSIAYLHCIAAKLGFEMEIPRIDNDSVDVVVCANGILCNDSILHSPKVDIQLKATTNWEISESDAIKFDLKIKNYDDLRHNCLVPKILVVLCLPKHEEGWISYSVDEIILRKRAYWKNLKGLPSVENGTQKRIHLNEIFTVNCLKETLTKISTQEW